MFKFYFQNISRVQQLLKTFSAVHIVEACTISCPNYYRRNLTGFLTSLPASFSVECCYSDTNQILSLLSSSPQVTYHLTQNKTQSSYSFLQGYVHQKSCSVLSHPLFTPVFLPSQHSLAVLQSKSLHSSCAPGGPSVLMLFPQISKWGMSLCL